MKLVAQYAQKLTDAEERMLRQRRWWEQGSIMPKQRASREWITAGEA